MPLRTLVTHGKRAKQQHEQERGISWLRAQHFGEETPAGVGGTVRELELEVEPEEETELWQSSNKTRAVERLLLMDEWRKWFVWVFLIVIVIQLQLFAFSPHPSTPPHLNPPPSPTSTLPLDFVHVSFIVVPVIPSPHCSLPTPPWLLLDCS